MVLLGAFASRLKAARARMQKDSRRGSAAVEFAMIAPIFFLFMFGIIETGVIYFAQSTFTSAVDDAAREIRTGSNGLKGAITAAQLRAAICDGFATSPSTEKDPTKIHSGLINGDKCIDAKDGVQVDVRVFNGFSGVTFPDVIDSDGVPNVNNLTVQATDACEVVLLRAYYPWPVLTPFMAQFMASMQGDKILLGSAASFRTEPYPDATRVTTDAC